MTKKEIRKLIRKEFKQFEISLNPIDVENAVMEVLEKNFDPRFDIRIKDSHDESDVFAAIDSTTRLTPKEVGQFILSGGDWEYEILPHGKPDAPAVAGGWNQHTEDNISY